MPRTFAAYDSIRNDSLSESLSPLSPRITRREWIRIGGIGLGGLSLPGLIAADSARSSLGDPIRAGKAKAAIILFLNGGPSQLDMWDLKPDAPEEIRGTFRPIATSTPGVLISEGLPRTARLSDKYSIIRSLCHEDADHPTAAYWMMIGSPIGRRGGADVTMNRVDRPHPGSVVAKLRGSIGGMPPFVLVPEAISPIGVERPGQFAGFLGPAYDPWRIVGDPIHARFHVGALSLPEGVGVERLADRRGLLAALDACSKALADSPSAVTLDSAQARAFDLITSSRVQKALDLSAESSETHDRYGRTIFGQSTLLARRLIESGVRLVHVNWVRHDDGPGGQGYDTHRNHLSFCKSDLFPPTDAAFGSLIEDLSDRGLLDETLVVLMGEFGRTPRFNKDGGRDHWPRCFSAILAGGGVRGGYVHGASDRIGASATRDPATPADLIATLYHALGVDHHAWLRDLQNRPLRIAEGEPIADLMT